MPAKKAPASGSSVPFNTSPGVDRVLVNALMENIPDFIYFKDKESRFIALTTALARYFGCTKPDQVVGKTDFDFFDDAKIRPSFEDEQKIIKTGKPIIGKIEKLVWPDGDITWVRTSKLPLRDGKGAIIGTFGLSQDITAHKATEDALEKSNKDLVDASRRAGMAEVATGVLHNVGNVLNSVNISVSVLSTGLRQSKAESLVKLAELVQQNASNLGHFVTEDPKGKLVPAFLESLARNIAGDREKLLVELEGLQKNIEHIKEIVTMQQSYATMVSLIEPLDASQLIEDALRLNTGALTRHEVKVLRDFKPTPRVIAERGKVLQILINLIRNAKYACDEAHPGHKGDKEILIKVEDGDKGNVRLSIKDNGIGIPRENLTRIFSHGFTTRPDGHGFGLHTSAIAAKQMNGVLSVTSDGPGHGATFTLDLPAAKPA